MLKKKIIPVLSAAVLIFIVIIGILIGRKIKEIMPGREAADIFEYFGITETSNADEYADMLANGESIIPIERNREVTEERAFLKDGQLYLDYRYIHDQLNDRFYWDANENVLLYTTSTDIIKANADSKDYFIGKKKDSKSYKIVLLNLNEAYVALDFVAEYTNLSYTFVEDAVPARLLLQTKWGTISKVNTKRKTQLRVKGGIKSEILDELDKGVSLVQLETMESWTKVCTENGLIGYVLNKHLLAPEEETESHAFAEDVFSHQTRDYGINMAWHQVTNTDSNSSISTVLQSTKGLNVISPTWFYLNDNDGNIANLASTDYVKYCHEQGVEVWGLVSNLENTEVSTTEVLTHTSKRENLTNQIIAAAIQYDLDGINVDFEALESAVGEGFIQFIRELSLKCESNGIVLSVDNYVSSEYTKFYDRQEQAVFADYIIVMAYDEHYSGSEMAGSVASIGFVKQASDDILTEKVPADQVILGMPFYTRVWAETPKDSDGDDVESASADYVPYELSSEAVGMESAVRLMEVNGAEKTWLDDMGQYYTEYVNDGVTYKIWFEDVTSIEEKLKVMDSHSFAGASFWKLGFEDSAVWDTIIKYIH